MQNAKVNTRSCSYLKNVVNSRTLLLGYPVYINLPSEKRKPHKKIDVINRFFKIQNYRIFNEFIGTQSS